MKIGMVKRLRIAYAFWRAFGVKNRNALFAVVHEGDFVDMAAGQISIEVIKTMQSEMEPAGYDYERR